jgi:peptide/nickel transport system substrate-binding protein
MIDEIIDPDLNPRPEYQKYQVQHMATMSLQYYGFQHQGIIFHDKRVRQAFCYAIDREKFCKFTLKNTGLPATYGMVPPGTGIYDHTVIKGYSFQPAKARELLAQAGYPQGKGFPKVTLQLNSGGARNSQVAEAIKKMLEETLNIQVDLLIVPWAQHSEAVEAAKTDFYRLGWIADYPDPENFLNLFHSKYVPASLSEKTYINTFRYKNKTYDTYFDQALATVDEKQRNLLYAKADQQAVDDAVVMPNYYDVDFRLLQPNIRNFPQNAMEYRVLEQVYLVPLSNGTKPK